jgi:hypothetical protein
MPLDKHVEPRHAVRAAEQVHEPSAAERRQLDEERQHLDELLDEGLRETFPASDAVAVVLQPPERPVARRPRRVRLPKIEAA